MFTVNSVQVREEILKPSYIYTGGVLGFLLGEVNLFFLLFPFADFFVTFGKWINLTTLTNTIGTMFGLFSLGYLFFAAKKFQLNWSRCGMLIAFIVLMVASVFWADGPMKAEAKTFTIRTVLTVFQALVIVKIFHEKGEEYVFDVLKRFSIIIGVMSALSIALFPSESSWTIDDTGRKQSFFSSPNNLGQFLSFFFLIINFYKRSSLSWPILIFLNALIVYQVIGCDSKTSLTGGILCFVLYHLRFLIKPFLVFVVGAGIYLPFYTQQFEAGEAEKIEFAKRDMTFTGRSDVWHIMMKDQREYKKDVLGFGAGGYWGEKDYHPKSRMHELEWEPHQGHNGYHDIKLMMGYVGITLFILFLVFYFRNIFRVLSNRNIFMLFMSVIFCINNITESSFFRGKHFFFVLMMLIFWYTVFKDKKDEPEAEEEDAEAAYPLQPVVEQARIDDFKRRG